MARGRTDRPPIKCAKGKIFDTEHHRALRIIFKETKIATAAESDGRLARKNVERLIKHTFPDLPKKHRYGHYYDRWIGRFKEKRPEEWWEIDRPNARNKDPYTRAELAEFNRIREMIVQAAEELDIEIPWHAEGEIGEEEGLADEDVDSGEADVDGEDEVDGEGGEAGRDLVEEEGGEEDVSRDGDLPSADSDELMAPNTQQDAPSEVSPRGMAKNSPAKLTTAHSITSTAKKAYWEPEEPKNITRDTSIDSRNAQLVPARLASMDNDLDIMDWDLSQTEAVDPFLGFTEQPDAQTTGVSSEYANIMARLWDPFEPYVRNGGEASHSVLGRP
ncbi:hypothetical protein PRZ48_008809 [Zasmidium cellare]|uniref:Uncharacterized protein n=1 Tax=Zasmidium cellare TaxID=395010 RepID=A0ABR0EH66_ZASCE|nr:hypothetical protein PRZ48_008809 [Zasmidium cellare]